MPPAKEMTIAQQRLDFAKRLRACIDQRGMTQSELAHKAQLNRRTVWDYLQGRTTPGEWATGQIATALRRKPEWVWPHAREPRVKGWYKAMALGLPEFDVGSFIARNFETVEALLSMLRSYDIPSPSIAAVNLWVSRNSMPGPWLATILSMLELETGSPVSVAVHVRNVA